MVEWHTRQLEVLESQVRGTAGPTPADDTKDCVTIVTMARDTTNDFVTKYERGVRTYAIWFNPDDFPGKYVVRGATSFANRVEADKECEVVDSLEKAREKIPHGMVWMARHPQDPPGIVECWV